MFNHWTIESRNRYIRCFGANDLQPIQASATSSELISINIRRWSTLCDLVGFPFAQFLKILLWRSIRRVRSDVLRYWTFLTKSYRNQIALIRLADWPMTICIMCGHFMRTPCPSNVRSWSERATFALQSCQSYIIYVISKQRTVHFPVYQLIAAKASWSFMTRMSEAFSELERFCVSSSLPLDCHVKMQLPSQRDRWTFKSLSGALFLTITVSKGMIFFGFHAIMSVTTRDRFPTCVTDAFKNNCWALFSRNSLANRSLINIRFNVHSAALTVELYDFIIFVA